MAARRRASIKGDSTHRRPSMREEGESDFEGYLEKFGTNKKWQRRYFEIYAHYLRYYPDSKKELAKMKGVVDLNYIKDVKMISSPKGHEIRINLDDPELGSQLFLLRAVDESNAESWMEHFDRIKASAPIVQDTTKIYEQNLEDEPAEADTAVDEDAEIEDTEETEKGDDAAEDAEDDEEDGPLEDEKKKESKSTIAMDLQYLSGVKQIPAPDGTEIRLTSGGGSVYMLKAAEEKLAQRWCAAFEKFQEEYAAKAQDSEKFFEDATNGTVIETKLLKNDKGLGLSIEGLDHGVHIITVVDGFIEGTPAEDAHRSGEILLGDVLLEINGKSCLDMPFEDVTNLFAGQDVVQLKISRKEASEEEVAMNLAAAKLQAMQRGRLGRKKAEQKKWTDSLPKPATAGKFEQQRKLVQSIVEGTGDNPLAPAVLFLMNQLERQAYTISELQGRLKAAEHDSGD